MRLHNLTPGELCIGDRIVWFEHETDPMLSEPVLFVTADATADCTTGTIHFEGAGGYTSIYPSDRFTVERD